MYLFKKTIAVVLCSIMVIANTISSFAINEIKTENDVIEMTIEQISEVSEDEIVEATPSDIEECEEEIVDDELIEEPEDSHEEDEDSKEETEEICEEISSSKIDETSDTDGIIEENEEECDDVIASPSEAEEISDTDNMTEENEEECDDVTASPSEIEGISGIENTIDKNEAVDENITASPSEIEDTNALQLVEDKKEVFKAGSNVCKIGSTEYLTIQDAINAVNDGETIVLISDISYTTAPNIIINNGKTFTIEFDDGTSIHHIEYNEMPPSMVPNDLITINNDSNVTINNAKFSFGMLNAGNNSIKVNSGSTLKLIDPIAPSSNVLVYNDGGDVIFDGGSCASSDIFRNMVIQTGGNLVIDGNPTFNINSYGLICVGSTTNTDANADAGNITIKSGTFTTTNSTSSLFELNAKANIKVEDTSFSYTSSTSYRAYLINLKNYGYKSTIDIDNMTSDTKYIVYSSSNSHLGDLSVNINDGKYIYDTGYLCKDSTLGASTGAVKITGGYFGPSTEDTDALNELNSNCAANYKAKALASTDPERANGYKYKIVYTSPVTEKYTVTFDSQGGSDVSKQKVEKNKKATKPSNPTKKNYLFVNWYKEKECVNVFDFNTAITANITLYAKWQYSGGGTSGGSSGGSGGGGGAPLYDTNGSIIRPGANPLETTAPAGVSYINASVNTAVNAKIDNVIWDYDIIKNKFALKIGSTQVRNNFCTVENNKTIDLYYIDNSGYVSIGWIRDMNSSWYFFDTDTANYGKAVKNGWKNIENKWYYFGSDGKLLQDTVTPDGYKVDINGVRIG